MVNDRQTLDLKLAASPGGEPVDWRQSDDPVPYPEAVEAMERRVAAIASGDIVLADRVAKMRADVEEYYGRWLALADLPEEL